MTEQGRRPPERSPRLTRAALLDAAEAIIADEGVDALTMRRIAERLESSTMALYRHVRDKDDLLVALLDRSAARVPRGSLPSDPKARLLAVCRVMRNGLAEQPWVVGILAKGDLIAPSVLWMIDEIVGNLIGCGLSETQAVAAYRTIWQFTVGELVIAHGVAGLGRPPFVLEVLEGADPHELPVLAKVADRWREVRGKDTYDHGIAALVNGLLRANGQDF